MVAAHTISSCKDANPIAEICRVYFPSGMFLKWKLPFSLEVVVRFVLSNVILQPVIGVEPELVTMPDKLEYFWL